MSKQDAEKLYKQIQSHLNRIDMEWGLFYELTDYDHGSKAWAEYADLADGCWTQGEAIVKMLDDMEPGFRKMFNASNDNEYVMFFLAHTPVIYFEQDEDGTVGDYPTLVYWDVDNKKHIYTDASPDTLRRFIHYVTE